MTIAIDNISPGLSTSRNTLGGMRSFLTDLVERLPAANPDLDFILFTPEWSDPFPIPIPANCRVEMCHVPRLRPGRVLFEQLVLPRAIQSRKVDFWLGTCNTLPNLRHSKTAVIVQSLQCFTQPGAFTPVRGHYLRKAIETSIRRADHIIAFSEHTRNDLVRILGVSLSRITVIFHWLPRAVRLALATPREPTKPPASVVSPYILCVSALYRYKNIPRLVEAFVQLKGSFPNVSLVLAGAETPELTYAEVKALAESRSLGNSVVLAGRVDDDTLRDLYRNAAVLAMPSLDETFGLPILEALHHGVPVVTSQSSPMAEIAGSAAVLVDPLDQNSIAQALSDVLSDSDLSNRLVRNGKSELARFDIDASISDYSALIRQAIGNGISKPTRVA